MPAKSTQAAQPGRGLGAGRTPRRTAPSGGRSGTRASAPGAAARTARSGSPSGPRSRRCARCWSTPSRGELVEPSKQKFGAYGAEVIDGLRVKPQTKASYIKNWRNHIASYPLADVPLAQLTGVRLTAHYRVLEKSGRKDHKAGEPPVGADGALHPHDHPRRPRPGGEGRPAGAQPGRRGHAADRPRGEGPGDDVLDASPARRLPGLVRASTPRITPCGTCSPTPGMRRGEALSLRWRDVDLDAATVASAGRRASSASPARARR